MKSLFKTAAIFVTGVIAGTVWVETSTNKGEVIYEDDDKYIRADKHVNGGTSWAKVFYKKPR